MQYASHAVTAAVRSFGCSDLARNGTAWAQFEWSWLSLHQYPGALRFIEGAPPSSEYASASVTPAADVAWPTLVFEAAHAPPAPVFQVTVAVPVALSTVTAHPLGRLGSETFLLTKWVALTPTCTADSKQSAAPPTFWPDPHAPVATAEYSWWACFVLVLLP